MAAKPRGNDFPHHPTQHLVTPVPEASFDAQESESLAIESLVGFFDLLAQFDHEDRQAKGSV